MIVLRAMSIALAGVLLVSCAKTILEEDAAIAEGGPPPPPLEQGVPPTAEAGVPPPPTPDMARRPPMDMGGGQGGQGGQGGGDCAGAPECEPDARLGLCEVCDPCGQPTVPADDDECPAVNCGGRAQYARQGNTCYVLRPQVVGGRCLGPGSCRDPDDVSACGEEERQVALRLEGECRAMQGCQGVAPPELVPAANGTPCGDEGVCQNGRCNTELGEECAAYGGITCEVGVHPANGEPFCQVAIEGGGSCREVCAAVDGNLCLLAWTSNAGCATEREVSCLEQAPRLLCRCTRSE